LENLIKTSNKRGKHIYLLGDLNYDINPETDISKQSQDFIEMLTSYGIKPLIYSPTRVTPSSETIIDNIFTNQYDRKITSGTISFDLESDHLPIYSVMRKLLDKETPALNVNEFTRDYSDKNKEKFKEKLKIADMSPVFRETDPNKIMNTLDLIFNRLYYSCFPKKKINKKKNTKLKKPWIKDDLLKLRNSKEDAFNRYIRNPSKEKENAYKRLRNLFNNLERKANLNHNEILLSNSKNSKERCIWRN